MPYREEYLQKRKKKTEKGNDRNTETTDIKTGKEDSILTQEESAQEQTKAKEQNKSSKQ